MKLKQVCLLITGCISPPKQVYMLSVKDCNERKKQYIDSIEFYLRCSTFENIVFCENSSGDPEHFLYDIAKSMKKKFEWISFKGNSKKVIECGKGYGEGEIIKYALENSELLRESEYIVKVTGRLKIRNINLLIKLLKRNNHFTILSSERVSTIFYIVKIDDYKRYFLDAHSRVNDRNGCYLEHIFYQKLKKSNIQYRQLPTCAYIEGVSGSTGKRYNKDRIRILLGVLELFIYSVTKE